MKVGDKVIIKSNPYLADIINIDLLDEIGLIVEYPFEGIFGGHKVMSVALIEVGDIRYPIGVEKLELMD